MTLARWAGLGRGGAPGWGCSAQVHCAASLRTASRHLEPWHLGLGVRRVSALKESKTESKGRKKKIRLYFITQIPGLFPGNY